jgi:hypothetical protein
LSAKFDSPIVLALGPSRGLAFFFLASHVGAALLVATLQLPVISLAAIWALISLSGADALTRHAWRRRRRSVVEVALDGDGQHTLRFRGDADELAFTVSGRFLHPLLALVTVHCSGCRGATRIVIPADAVEAERFRRWRARVRLQTAAD